MSRLDDRVITRLASGLAVPALPDRYELLEVIGRGGMGVVWRAHDHQLGRDVAVKVLGEHLTSPDLALRLSREARILARLEHPGIVAVHDAGTLADDRTWYAMRLVKGERLDVAAAHFASLGDVLRVVTRVAETVAYAHSQRILHRDLTPRNVMLGPFGEVLILDWGVARGLTAPEDAVRSASPDVAQEGLTSHGTILGTPGYMPPEQEAGLPADERADVYGLGALLRGLLQKFAGRPPKPLAAICARACAADPAQRYPDASSFRDDLVRFQDGAAVSAYRENPLETIQRVARQHRTLILLIAAYLTMRVVILLWRGI